MKPARMLILSFSPIANDARVMKQVEEFGSDFELTTCGYGLAPAGVARHIRIPDDVAHNVLHDGRITRRAYRRAYWSLWSIAWARRRLPRRHFDVVLANDVEAVPLALHLRPLRGVHADLHEYSPLLHEDWQGWREKITPYVEWLCSEYVARAHSWSTVSRGLVREYERNFGFHAELVTNAAPFRDARPHATARPIRLVHSGAALADRRLHELIAGVQGSEADVTLDLYLTPNQPAYLEELRELAAESAGRVRVCDPVPYEDLVGTLAEYDVGVHLLAPTNFNNRWALPNKLFDYVQARLGVIVGPTAEMADLVRDRGIGVVAPGFSAADLSAVLNQLESTAVDSWKSAADASARDLSAQSQVAVWRRAVDGLMRDSGARVDRA